MENDSNKLHLMELRHLLFDVVKGINREPRLYTVEEAAAILKTSEETVRNHLWRTKTLRYCKIGREVRIREKDLEEFIDMQLVPCVNDQELLK